MRPRKKISVVFDTMWQSTEKMAKIMTEVFMDEGIEVKLMKLREWHRSDVMAEILDSRAVCIGSPDTAPQPVSRPLPICSAI